MPDSPSPAETTAAAYALLVEAIGTLEALGIEVMIDGDPPRYVVVGVARTEGEVIAMASRLASARSERRQ